LKYLVEGIAVAVLAIPLLRLTRVAYDPVWWQWSEQDVLPFPSPWSIRSPLWAWYLLFWLLSISALSLTASRGSTATLAIVVAALEAAYALVNRGRKSAVDPRFPKAILAYALWHNAVLEELLFRGLPLLVGIAVGLSKRSFWPYVYIGVTAVAFGLYHLKRNRNRPQRFYDTTIFGLVLAWVVLQYGFLAAVLVHSIHNALSIPLGHTDVSLHTWRRNRWLYVASLMLIAFLRLA
jgi:hypothetical protein